ncbi:MAG: methyltransferase domain-containing protein, partial [Anaerolineae bacterium]|nr:methyltransferase domain-containing protein [Anaerolineae bacterium]
MTLSEQAVKNRAFWDNWSDEYQAQHAEQLNKRELAWGVWALPERELGVLGDVAGKDILELGCGAAQWSIFLAKLGSRPVGLDNSSRQLDHARELMAAHGVAFPLVHAS